MIRSPYALKVPDLVNNALIDIIGGDMMKKATSMHLTRFYQQNMAAAPFCAPPPNKEVNTTSYNLVIMYTMFQKFHGYRTELQPPVR